MLFVKHEQKKILIIDTLRGVFIANTLHIQSILHSCNNTFLQDRKWSGLMIDPIILSRISSQVQLLSRIKKGNLASQGLGFVTRLLHVEMKRFDQMLSIKHIHGLVAG